MGKIFKPNQWVRVDEDGTVTVTVSKSEMGQGVYTALPMIIAEEMDADWDKIKVEPAMGEKEYDDPISGTQVTGGSTSIRNMMDALRIAGAQARSVLIEAASLKLNVSKENIITGNGIAVDRVSGRKISYGELVNTAVELNVPSEVSLKSADDFKIIGKSIHRVDVDDKVDGDAKFGIDVFLPGMLYAVEARPNAYGAKPLSFDKETALGIMGVKNVVQVGNSIAVCAETIGAAIKGRDALSVRWEGGSDPLFDTDRAKQEVVSSLDRECAVVSEKGGIPQNDGTYRKVEASYFLPYISHAQLEPTNCTVDLRDEECHIWISTQAQTRVKNIAAKITGIPKDKIYVHTTYIGGGFGRHLEIDPVDEALIIAKEVKRPVKLIWMRKDDMLSDYFHPANAYIAEGWLDEKGYLKGLHFKLAAPSVYKRVYPNAYINGIDPGATESMVNMPYNIDYLKIEYTNVDTIVPVGFWRAVGPSRTAFAVESFIDELAYAAGKDPMEFRLELLKDNPRAANVVKIACDKAGWGKELPDGCGMGLAFQSCFGSLIAEVAEVSVVNNQIRVNKVTCAVDCGIAINPDIVKAQITGGVIMGLSGALKEKIEFSNGGVKTFNFYNYHMLRMNDSPEVEVTIVDSGERVGGIGETGVPPIAPAVANAVYSATGIRLRELPLNLTQKQY